MKNALTEPQSLIKASARTHSKTRYKNHTVSGTRKTNLNSNGEIEKLKGETNCFK